MNRGGGSVVSQSLFCFFLVEVVPSVLADNTQLTSSPEAGRPNLKTACKRALDSTMQTV